MPSIHCQGRPSMARSCYIRTTGKHRDSLVANERRTRSLSGIMAIIYDYPSCESHTSVALIYSFYFLYFCVNLLDNNNNCYPYKTFYNGGIYSYECHP